MTRAGIPAPAATRDSASGRRALGRAATAFAIAALAFAAPAGSAPTAATAAEPPAYPASPPPRAEARATRGFVAELALQQAWAGMGEWNDGVASLESGARASGLAVTTSNLPATTTSFEAAILARLRPGLFAGIQYDRPTGKSEFAVREASGGGALAEYPTEADATSNAWLVAARWTLPGARRGTSAYAQAAAGVGSARLQFSAPGGTALGKGHGFAGSLELGVVAGDGPLGLRFAAGWRHHRTPLSYSGTRASSQSGGSRFAFDFDDELRDFVAGRDLDLGGPFARIGATLAWER